MSKKIIYIFLVAIGLSGIGYFFYVANINQDEVSNGVENRPASSMSPDNSMNPISCHLTLGWSEWPPYLENVDKSPAGFQIEFVNWVAKELSCDISYRQMTWQQNLIAIEKGEIDLLGRASKIPEREKYAYFSQPYRQDMLVLAGRKGEGEKFVGMSLPQVLDTGFTIGVLAGGYLGETTEAIRQDKKYQNSFRLFALESEIIKAIDNNQIDGIFEAPFTLENALKQNDLQHSLEKFPVEIIIGDVHFMFSKKTTTQNFVTKFNQAMEKVKQSDAYHEHWFWTMVL